MARLRLEKTAKSKGVGDAAMSQEMGAAEMSPIKRRLLRAQQKAAGGGGGGGGVAGAAICSKAVDGVSSGVKSVCGAIRRRGSAMEYGAKESITRTFNENPNPKVVVAPPTPPSASNGGAPSELGC